MLRYRKVYFDLNLKIINLIITQVSCSVLILARSKVGYLKDKKNNFVANNFIANDLAYLLKRICWHHCIHDESRLFYLPEASLIKEQIIGCVYLCPNN